MIEPINPTPLNMANKFKYHCGNCGEDGYLNFDNFINIPDKADDGVYDIYNQYCPSCDSNLKNRVIMSLDNEPFRLIKDSLKTIEVRLNDEKRQSIEMGDIIKFVNIKTKQCLKVKVIDLLRYPDFESLFNSYNIHDFGSNNKKTSLDKMRGYYSKDDERKYGVLGIKIELLK